MNEPLKAPFPWFGGKSKAADLIWGRIGQGAGNYVEPFLGSCAVWLGRPPDYSGAATLNDLDGNIANFWRAMQAAPDEVARAVDWPVNECDLHARHLWLVRNLPKLSARLMADPDYYDAKTAGWWAWGACSWIAGGWCSGEGPWWTQLDDEGVPVFCKADGGQGVKRQLPHLNAGQGVNRKLPHLGDAGKGERIAWLLDWFNSLSNSLREARVTCGDWQRVCSVGTMTRLGPCAVLMDPPYSQTDAVYAHDSSAVAHVVREWCIANGSNPRLMIALCGHAGEHETIEAHGWTVETWAKGGGYQGKDDRERIWFSPHCAKPKTANQQASFFS